MLFWCERKIHPLSFGEHGTARGGNRPWPWWPLHSPTRPLNILAQNYIGLESSFFRAPFLDFFSSKLWTVYRPVCCCMSACPIHCHEPSPRNDMHRIRRLMNGQSWWKPASSLATSARCGPAVDAYCACAPPRNRIGRFQSFSLMHLKPEIL